MSSDLAAFILARQAEREAAARAATAGPWEVGSVDDDLADVWGQSPNKVTAAHDYPCCTVEDAEHIARHDPAWVLADVAAKRRLVRWAMRWPMRPPKASDGIAAEDYILLSLAQPDADHPDFDPAWKVGGAMSIESSW